MHKKDFNVNIYNIYMLLVNYACKLMPLSFYSTRPRNAWMYQYAMLKFIPTYFQLNRMVHIVMKFYWKLQGFYCGKHSIREYRLQNVAILSRCNSLNIATADLLAMSIAFAISGCLIIMIVTFDYTWCSYRLFDFQPSEMWPLGGDILQTSVVNL